MSSVARGRKLRGGGGGDGGGREDTADDDGDTNKQATIEETQRRDGHAQDEATEDGREDGVEGR